MRSASLRLAHLVVRTAEDDADLVPRAVEIFLKDRKSTRLNSSHVKISYAVFCFSHPLHLHSFPTRRSSDLSWSKPSVPTSGKAPAATNGRRYDFGDDDWTRCAPLRFGSPTSLYGQPRTMQILSHAP